MLSKIIMTSSLVRGQFASFDEYRENIISHFIAAEISAGGIGF
jgi:hypothetical protein